MASARNLFGKLKSSDGRIKAGTASGVLAVVVALALLVVLPASAAPGGPSGDGVQPIEVGGNPSCSDLLDAGDYLFEHKTDKPTSETIELSFDELSGSVTVVVRNTNSGQVFDFSFSGDFEAAAVIVKGGPNANLYDYRPGGNVADTGLHAPVNPQNGRFHSLSHISFCIGEAPNFFCDTPVTLTDEEGPIVEVTAAIFANALFECFDKDATFTNDGNQVTLAFEGDGTLTAAGRLDFTKEFGSPPDFDSLQYDGSSPGTFVDVIWCNVRGKDTGDGDEFDDVLESNEYPSLLDDNEDPLTDDGGQATACKVFETEDASGTQYTVVYFQFEDPNFR